ncbi:MAG: MBL fold metallo-hydrolase [Sphingobacteriales bacterium JAD_PAG50586_3]|nr:MAG: MBL fold metallo-hydrolase [Sphingobacteriales bacterium JAD_PAG50586_3]
MINKIHHLNCATLRPLGKKVICHCLLLETDTGLILVDTGLGMQDVQNPGKRLSTTFRLIMNAVLDSNETALKQIEQLGFTNADVKYIISTHLHEDHAGGINDFPDAEVILSEREYNAVIATPNAGAGFSKAQLQNIKWKKAAVGTENWNGFTMQKVLDGIWLVDLEGHTFGQCGVLMDYNNKQYFHCADSYYSRQSLVVGFGKTPFMFKLTQWFTGKNKQALKENEQKLYNLYHQNIQGLEMFCSHDVDEFERLRNI